MVNSGKAFDVGANVARLREERGWSLEQLVSAMRDLGYGWNRTTLFNIEHNMRRLQFQEAYDLLECLGLDPMKDMALLCRVDDAPVSVLADERRNEYARKLIKAWGDYVSAREAYEATVRHDLEQGNVDPEWARLSRDFFDRLDARFRQAVNEDEPDAHWGESFLHGFPTSLPGGRAPDAGRDGSAPRAARP